MTYFGILQTLKVCAVVSCILQKRKVYGHRIYKCEIRYIYKCKSLGELTSASREDKSLYFRSKLVSSTPRPFGEITVLGLIKCRQKQKKKRRQNPSVLSSKKPQGMMGNAVYLPWKCGPLCIPLSTILGTQE